MSALPQGLQRRMLPSLAAAGGQQVKKKKRKCITSNISQLVRQLVEHLYEGYPEYRAGWSGRPRKCDNFKHKPIRVYHTPIALRSGAPLDFRPIYRLLSLAHRSLSSVLCTIYDTIVIYLTLHPSITRGLLYTAVHLSFIPSAALDNAPDPSTLDSALAILYIRVPPTEETRHDRY